MGVQQEIAKQFREQQEKYIYYLIALSVAAIAFAVNNTLGEPIRWSQLPLGLSVISWGISIYCGLSSLQYLIGSLLANMELIRAKKEQSPKATEIQDAISDVSERTKCLVKTQRCTFFAGIIFYLVWHIIEMIIKSYC